MRKRVNIHEDSETVIVIGEPPPPSRIGRLLGFIGTLVVQALFSLILVYFFLIPGIYGIQTKQFKLLGGRISRGKMLYGDEAVGLAWIHMGFGFVLFIITWRMARERMENHGPVADLIHRVIFWLLVVAMVICFGTGVQRLFSAG